MAGGRSRVLGWIPGSPSPWGSPSPPLPPSCHPPSPQPAPLKLSTQLEARLSPGQKLTLHLNRALLLLLSGRCEAARDTAAAVTRQYGDSTPLALLRAAILVAEGMVREGRGRG